MDKESIYDALKEDGARLKPANFYTQEQLQDMYIERFGEKKSGLEQPETSNEQNDTKPTQPETIHTLFFSAGGWCDELNKSFAPGYYRPESIEEYTALKKFASREV